MGRAVRGRRELLRLKNRKSINFSLKVTLSENESRGGVDTDKITVRFICVSVDGLG